MYHFGYYVFYFSYDQHLERKWMDVIYSENSILAQETLIEIPFTAPYISNQEEFNPTNTSYEKDGQFFRAIKQRYQNDTLQVIVVRDIARGMLYSTFKRWVSFLIDDEFPQEHNGKTIISLLVKDYLHPVPYFFEFFASIISNSKIQLAVFFYLDDVHVIESPPPLSS